ncbi:MAG: sensor histidine kinase [Devosia sp.]|nr:sensor histidine kinase [Devosia sp.]
MTRLWPTGSLRLNLIVWLVLPGATILVAGAWLSYASAERQATLVMDRQLAASARMMAEAVTYADGNLSVLVPPSALELFATDSHDEVAYEVIGPAGELLAGYPGLNAPADLEASNDPAYFATMFRTESMRATLLRQPVVTPSGTVFASVMVGETLKARDELVWTLWQRGFAEQAALIVAGALAIWVGITRQLRPLLRLRQDVLDRPADRFEPFDASAVQTEVRPLVLALNNHMERLRAQLERQRRFLDNAAHQLRTPLAIMKTQVGYARRAPDVAEIDLTLREVDGNLTAMARLTNQLLTLGGVEHQRDLVQAEAIDLERAVQDPVREAAQRALDNGIELAFDGEGLTQVWGSPLLVHEMLANLIDNTIQHAGPGAVATFSVRRAVQDVVLRVEDNGRGIENVDRAGLLERFHRGANAKSGGSGLGLAIVAEIAEAMGGSVELPPPRGRRGFCVVVRLPSADSSGRG